MSRAYRCGRGRLINRIRVVTATPTSTKDATMITTVRMRLTTRRQQAELAKIFRNSDRRGRDELIVIAQRQGLI